MASSVPRWSWWSAPPAAERVYTRVADEAAWAERRGGLRSQAPANSAGEGVARLIDAGAIRPVVGDRFPLERAADALVTIDERRATGKVVLDVR